MFSLKGIFGGERLAEARSQVTGLRRIREGRKLKGAEREALRNAEATVAGIQSRRRFLIACATLVGGAAAIGIGSKAFGLFDKDELPDEPEDVPARNAAPEPFNVEQQTDILIQRIESGFSDFENEVRPLVERVPDAQFRAELMSPFEVMRLNQENPERNGPRYHRVMREHGEIEVQSANPYHFFYAANSNLGHMAAGVESLSRVMYLSPNLDTHNYVDMLVFYHELRHVAQHTNIRMNLHSPEEWEAYKRFNTMLVGEKPRININEEATAYAFEIELLNLMLNGELKMKIRSGDQIDIQSLHRRLRGRTNQIGTVELFVVLARAYYPNGMSSGGFPRRFVDEIAVRERALGKDIFISSRDGGMVLYR